VSAVPPVLTTSTNGVGVVPDGLLNTFVQGGATVASLQSFNNALSNMMVATVGQNTPGDGFSGIYYWNAASTATADGLTVVQPNGVIVGRWLALNMSFSAPRPYTYNVTTAPAAGNYLDVWAPISYNVSGASTLGSPFAGAGYYENPLVSPIYINATNSSGINNSTTGNASRSLFSLGYFNIVQGGQGDATGWVVNATITSTKPGASNWLASPAASAYLAQVNVFATGGYGNPRETDITDTNGTLTYAASAFGDVVNLTRNNGGTAIGQTWGFARYQSLGTVTIDAVISAVGTLHTGIDFSAALFDVNQGAIALAPNQRIYLGATNSDPDGFPVGTNPTGPYIVNAGGIAGFFYPSGGDLQLSSASALLNISAGGTVQVTASSASINMGTVGVSTNGTVNSVTGPLQLGGTAAPEIFSVTGVPTLAAPNGSMALRSDGTTGAHLYINASGSTIWNAVSGV
jgi:hypothetical protein